MFFIPEAYCSGFNPIFILWKKHLFASFQQKFILKTWYGFIAIKIDT